MPDLLDSHDAIRALFERAGATSDAQLDVLARASSGIWSAACAWVDPVLVAAVARRALSHACEKFPALSALVVDPATGIDVRPLRQHAATVQPGDVRGGAVFFVDEFATVLGGCCGQLLDGDFAAVLRATDDGARGALHDSTLDDPTAARRLRCLQLASRSLASYRPVDEALASVVAAVEGVLPLRVASVVLARGERPRRLVWHADEASADSESQALVTYAYLAGISPPELPKLEVVRTLLANASPRPASQQAASSRPRDFALPLVSSRGHVFGLLWLEPSGTVSMADLELASDLAVQIARALEPTETARAVAEGADSGEQAQRELLSVISHDLRNPLSAILMSVVLLLRRQAAAASGAPTGTGDPLRQLEVIKRSAERMNYIIQNLVDAVALENGQVLIDPQVNKLAPIADDGVRLLASVANSKTIKLENQVPGDLQAPFDRERLLQTLSNLLTACVRFAAKGARVAVGIEPTGADEAIHVVVSAEGPGVAADEAEHVFDRRWWARRSSGLSMGLGLSVAKGIVEAHGGRIWLTTVPGSGNAFHFTLPRVRVIVPDATDAAVDARAS